MTKFYFMQDANGHVFEACSPEYHKECKQLTQAEGNRLLRLQTVETVRNMLQGVNTVYGIVRSVSASGMSRCIDLYVIRDNKPEYLTGYASRILGYKMSKNRGMIVSGCGMDMVFHCVSSLVEACGVDYKTIRSEAI